MPGVVVESHPPLDPPHEGEAIEMVGHEGGDVLVGKGHVLLLRHHAVEVLVARRAPHEHLTGLVAGEVAEGVGAVGAGAAGLTVVVVDDAAAVLGTADRVEIEPHRRQHVDDRLGQVGRPEHVAAQVEQEVLGLGLGRGPAEEGTRPGLELERGQDVDLAKVLRERELVGHGAPILAHSKGSARARPASGRLRKNFAIRADDGLSGSSQSQKMRR
jgi:hypothetical protein